MSQKSTTRFTSECGKAQIFVENDMPIGVFHDFLMEIKGLMVERMVVAHKQQVAEMEAQKQADQPAVDDSPCDNENCV